MHTNILYETATKKTQSGLHLSAILFVSGSGNKFIFRHQSYLKIFNVFSLSSKKRNIHVTFTFAILLPLILDLKCKTRRFIKINLTSLKIYTTHKVRLNRLNRILFTNCIYSYFYLSLPSLTLTCRRVIHFAFSS